MTTVRARLTPAGCHCSAPAGLAIIEVPSFEYERIHGESNLNTFRDGRRVLKTIFTE